MRSFEQYVRESLGIPVRARPWQPAEGLPFYLKDRYSFYETSLLDRPCIVMVSRGDSEDTPATLRKHMEQVQNMRGAPCIYVREAITAYNRKRLIEHHVPFVVPGNQMYLPELAIDLREHFRRIRNIQKPFSPATQVVIISALMGDKTSKISPSNLAKRFGYSAMTMTRSLDEIESADLGEVYQEGRERLWQFMDDKRTLWEKARPLMQSPVRRRAWIGRNMSNEEGVATAGLTALSHYSMLSAPRYHVWAIGSEQWKVLRQSGLVEVPYPEPEAHELEVWSYSPTFFARNGVVDPFSLYLSLQETKDERIESALAEMMEHVQW